MGGVETLRQLAFQLPPELNAPVLVVLHTSPGGPGMLPALLASSGQLPAQHARDKEKIEPGRIYVAPPDHHLETQDGHLRINRGPKVNMTRPAIDNLFESAARDYGHNAIGVLLTGALSDGVLGLSRIKEHGGTAIVQEPADAACPVLPKAALAQVKVDYTAPLKQMALLLMQLVDGEQQRKPTPVENLDTTVNRKRIEVQFDWICPECHGPLKEIHDGSVPRFRCRVGHEYTTDTLLQAHGDSMERALWTAAQVLEERAELLKRVCQRMPDEARSSKQEFQEKAAKFIEHAAEIKRILENMDTGRE